MDIDSEPLEPKTDIRSESDEHQNNLELMDKLGL